jgi:hypothetical protein
MQPPTVDPSRQVTHRPKLRFVLLFAAATTLLLAACGDSDGDGQVLVAPDPPGGDPQGVAPLPVGPNEEPPALFHGDEMFEPGGFATVYLRPESSGDEIALVTAAIEDVLSGSEFSYGIQTHEPFAIGLLEPGLFDADPNLLACFRYDLSPRLDIELKEPDPALLQRVADAMAGHPAVSSVESPGLEFGYTDVPEEYATEAMVYEEFLYETCESGQIWVLIDPSLDDAARRALAERLLALPAVSGVVIDRDFGDEVEHFIPDLSEYPQMANCEGPQTSSLRAILSAADEASSAEVVAAFGSDAQVLGFLGRYLADSLDPILAWENQVDWELCERLTAFVELDSDITDADAAVVVARALGVLGVADIELNLYDPTAPDGCEESGDEPEEEGGAPPPDAMGISVGNDALGSVAVPVRSKLAAALSPTYNPCYVPETSTMTIYRGDPDLATHRALAAALCDLPGVLSIGSYDEAISDLDPYADCQALHLDVRMAPESDEAARQAVRDLLVSSDHVVGVTTFDEFFGGDGYRRPIPEVVVGNLDVFTCDPELAWESGAIMNARLARIDEQQARSLADQILAVPGVVDVTGNAVRGDSESGADCGIDFLWLWFSPESTESQRSAVFDLLAGRSDVLAVTLVDEGEDSHVHDGVGLLPSRWAGAVTFGPHEEPADIEALVAQIEAMPGVAKAERIYGEGGDVFEGDIVEEVYEDAPEPVG